jgi:hypothetical protein
MTFDVTVDLMSQLESLTVRVGGRGRVGTRLRDLGFRHLPLGQRIEGGVMHGHVVVPHFALLLGCEHLDEVRVDVVTRHLAQRGSGRESDWDAMMGQMRYDEGERCCCPGVFDGHEGHLESVLRAGLW